MTEEAKKALEAAQTEEDIKAVAEKFELTVKKLSDEELDQIVGGSVAPPGCVKRDNKYWC